METLIGVSYLSKDSILLIQEKALETDINTSMKSTHTCRQQRRTEWGNSCMKFHAYIFKFSITFLFFNDFEKRTTSFIFLCDLKYINIRPSLLQSITSNMFFHYFAFTANFNQTMRFNKI